MAIADRNFRFSVIKQNYIMLEDVFYKLSTFIKPGVKEEEISCFARHVLEKVSGSAVVWDCCLGSGPNSSNPSCVPTSRVVRKDEWVLVDIFPLVSGYYCDITRTFFTGERSGKSAEMFDYLADILTKAGSILKPGLVADEADNFIRSQVSAFAGNYTYTHHTGHGVSTEQMCKPILVPGSADIIKIGDIIAVEPGIYVPGEFGIRLENTFIITDDGCKCINKLPLKV